MAGVLKEHVMFAAQNFATSTKWKCTEETYTPTLKLQHNSAYKLAFKLGPIPISWQVFPIVFHNYTNGWNDCEEDKHRKQSQAENTSLMRINGFSGTHSFVF